MGRIYDINYAGRNLWSVYDVQSGRIIAWFRTRMTAEAYVEMISP